MNVRDVIPFARIDHAVCVAGRRRTLREVEALYPGADYIINTGIFLMKTGEILGRVNAGGVRFGKAADACGIDFTGTPRPSWGEGREYVGPYSYAVRDGKIADGLCDREERGRTALGLTRDALIVRVISDRDNARCTTEELCRELLELGCVHGINLDGGASSQGKTPGQRYESARSVPCWLCIWLKKKEKSVMKVKCRAKTQVYDAIGNPEKNRWIDAGDACELETEILGTLQAKIVYPTSDGKRTAYVRDLGNFIPG